MFEGAWIIRLNNNPGNKDVAKRLPAPQDYGLSRWSGSHILLRRRNKRYSAQKWSRKIQLSRRFVDLKFHQLSQIRYTRSSWRRLLLWQASTQKAFSAEIQLNRWWKIKAIKTRESINVKLRETFPNCVAMLEGWQKQPGGNGKSVSLTG